VSFARPWNEPTLLKSRSWVGAWCVFVCMCLVLWSWPLEEYCILRFVINWITKFSFRSWQMKVIICSNNCNQMRIIGMSFARPSNELTNPTRSWIFSTHYNLGNLYLDWTRMEILFTI
jgi:hypothetical protein